MLGNNQIINSKFTKLQMVIFFIKKFSLIEMPD